MSEFTVEDSIRKIRRDVFDQLGFDITRYLVELVTNSDDSYKRLENSTEVTEEYRLSVKNINIVYNDKNKEADYFEVIDCAEGMDDKRMQTVFQKYGGDNAGGEQFQTRGIFGQGASDVLKASALSDKRASIKSIKDGNFYEMKYFYDKSILKFKGNPQLKSMNVGQLKDFRQKYGISENGTIFQFGVPRNVKINKKQLKESIELNPMLRYILNDKKRNITLEIISNKNSLTKTSLSSSRFIFNDADKLDELSFSFKDKEDFMNCSLVFYKNNDKVNNKTQILVKDSNNVVFANTMFGYEMNSECQKLSGVLTIEGLYEIAKERLNSETNAEAIITPNRTGFDEKKDFYQNLKKTMRNYIEQAIKDYGEKTNSVDLVKNKKWNDALNNLNKYAKDLLKENIGGGNQPGFKLPENGIAFARDKVTLSTGKTYDLKLYIDSNKVNQNEIIKLQLENNLYVNLITKEVLYKEEEVDEGGLVTKNVTLEAVSSCEKGSGVTLTATCGDKTAKAYIEVIDKEIHYPNNGIEFFPSKINSVFPEEHKGCLFIDTNLIPISSQIVFSSSTLQIKEQVVTLKVEDIVANSIAKIEVYSIGGRVGETHKVLASFNKYNSELYINITEKSDQSKGSNGLISGFRIKNVPQLDYARCYLEPGGLIIINSANPINMLTLGEMKNKDLNNPSFTPTETKFLCDMIANEAARVIMEHETGFVASLSSDNPLDAYEQAAGEIGKRKNEAFVTMYKALMNLAE